MFSPSFLVYFLHNQASITDFDVIISNTVNKFTSTELPDKNAVVSKILNLCENIYDVLLSLCICVVKAETLY